MASNFTDSDLTDRDGTLDRRTCSICLEIFRQPRKLTCNHSFCSVCLQEYIEKCISAKDVKTFPCPLCRASIQIKQEDEDILKQFRLLSFSKDDSETESRNNDQAIINCESCLRDSVTIRAFKFCEDCGENICKDCIKYHKKNKILSSHTLSNIKTDENIGKDACKNIDLLAKFNVQMKCERHSMKRLKYICVDHNALCCSKCVIEEHRQCTDIKQVEEYVKTKLFDDKRENLTYCLKDVDKKSRQIHTHETFVEKMLTKKRASIAEQFDTFRTFTLKVLDEELEKSLSLIQDLMLSSEAKRRKVESEMSKLDNCKEIFEMTERENLKGSQALAIMKRVDESLLPIQSQIAESLNSASSDTVECLIDNDLLKETLQNCFKCKVFKIPISDAAVLQSTFDKYVSCKGRSCLRDCDMLDNTYCLSADEKSRSIRVFDITSQKELEQIHFEAEPFGLTSVDIHTIAVSFPREKLINVMRVTVKGLTVTSKLVRKVTTEFGIYGIDTCTEGSTKMLVGLDKELGCLRMYNMEGKEHKVINLQIPESEKPLRGWNVLSYANYFAIDNKMNQIYISCQKTNRIICIDLRGKCIGVFKHQTLQTPLAIKIGPNGHLYVCCYESCRVLAIDKVGNIVGVISDKPGLSGPTAMNFDGDFRRCIVCDDVGEGKFRMVFYSLRVLEGQ